MVMYAHGRMIEEESVNMIDNCTELSFFSFYRKILKMSFIDF